MMTIDEIMTRDPITLNQKATLNEAAELMRQKRIRHIPVVSTKNRLVGLITQRDLVAETKSARDARKVGDVMRKKVQTINENTELRAAALKMQREKIGCLPVLRDEALVGIITDTDYVGLAINLLEQLETMEPPEFDDDFDAFDDDDVFIEHDEDF